MSDEYYKIKDSCRRGLLVFLHEALSVVPEFENPKILDAGCGSGVPTLMMAQKYPKGLITAVDLNANAMGQLMEKIDNLKLNERIKLLGGSVFTINFKSNLFDIILAEGFLNVVGFEKGFIELDNLLKTKGYMIIHDTFKESEFKKHLMEEKGYEIVKSFLLNEKVWWNNYYKTLETNIDGCSDQELKKLFKSDLLEIKQYRTNPFQFKSFYYVLKKSRIIESKT